MWDERAPRVPVEERTFGRESRTPLFTGPDGVTPWTTGDSRRVAKAMATVIGLDPENFGGKCWRIGGGATDLHAVLGEQGAKAIVQRGRWHTDIAQIYQRALADTQLQASAGMGDAGGADMEALFSGWTQPASFRR
eukprot:2223961-Pleurochrysis_carterae.AAC.1